jgi:DNA-directed RNA polymerase specialized sigma24 family protein
MMSNERYRNIVIYRYLKGLSNEDTAEKLQMTMPNYYNKHKLAKAQFENMLRREGLI